RPSTSGSAIVSSSSTSSTCMPMCSASPRTGNTREYCVTRFPLTPRYNRLRRNTGSCPESDRGLTLRCRGVLYVRSEVRPTCNQGGRVEAVAGPCTDIQQARRFRERRLSETGRRAMPGGVVHHLFGFTRDSRAHHRSAAG